jgi:hypothetical protein
MAKMKSQSDELSKVLQEVGTVIYQQAAADYAKQNAPPGETKQESEQQKPDDSPEKPP